MTLWEARPRDSKFLHKVETRGNLEGVIIFSPYDMHKDIRSWSHDSDFPWCLNHPDNDFNIEQSEEKFLVSATILEEWSMKYEDNITVADSFILKMVVEFWRKWRCQ